jgi:hypothetical protein
MNKPTFMDKFVTIVGAICGLLLLFYMFGYNYIDAEVRPVAKAARTTSSGEACAEIMFGSYCVSYRGPVQFENNIIKEAYQFIKMLLHVSGAEVCEYKQVNDHPGLYCLYRKP